MTYTFWFWQLYTDGFLQMSPAQSGPMDRELTLTKNQIRIGKIVHVIFTCYSSCCCNLKLKTIAFRIFEPKLECWIIFFDFGPKQVLAKSKLKGNFLLFPIPFSDQIWAKINLTWTEKRWTSTTTTTAAAFVVVVVVAVVVVAAQQW